MSTGEIIIYQTSDGTTSLDVKLEQESVWLTQAQMVELFSSTKQNISLHINNIFKEGELEKESVVKEYLTTAIDGKKYRTKFYNLDVVISVGYAVKENIKLEQYKDLKQTIKILANVLDHQTLEYSDTTGLLSVVTDYTKNINSSINPHHYN